MEFLIRHIKNYADVQITDRAVRIDLGLLDANELNSLINSLKDAETKLSEIYEKIKPF